MAHYNLTTPLSSEDTKKLVAGDTVLLNTSKARRSYRQCRTDNELSYG